MQQRALKTSRGPAAPALLVGVLLALGCASLGPRKGKSLESLLAARGLDPTEIVFPQRLTPEMKAWVHDKVPHSADPLIALGQLLRSLEDPEELGLTYQPGHTGTAAEVFASGRYNCLSFSHLFLGLARELGIDLEYLNVSRIRGYSRVGDVILVSGHVTVGYGAGPNRKVLEFNVGPNVDYRTAVPISDLTALALHYANRGAELIQFGDYRKALEWLETGVRIDPELPGIWVNLGVAQRRVGRVDEAERSYFQAIETDENFYPAYTNLAGLYRMRGQTDIVEKMFEVLEQRGNRNPYAFLALGDYSIEQGNLEDADRYYRRALRLSTRKAEALAALGQLAYEQGDFDRAHDLLERAKQADPAARRVVALELSLKPEQRPLAKDEAPFRID